MLTIFVDKCSPLAANSMMGMVTGQGFLCYFHGLPIIFNQSLILLVLELPREQIDYYRYQIHSVRHIIRGHLVVPSYDKSSSETFVALAILFLLYAF